MKRKGAGVSERWERECQALKAEVKALQQQLQALTAQPVGVNAPARRRVSRSVKWLLSICILLGGGGVLHGEGAMDALFIDQQGRIGIGTTTPEHVVDIRSKDTTTPFSIDNALYLGNYNGTVSISNNAYRNERGAWQPKNEQKKAFTLELQDSGKLELYGTATNGQADWQQLATFDGADKKIVFPVALNLNSSLSVSGDIWYQGHKFVLETGMFKNFYNVEATSDQRLKKDITPLTHAAEKVRRLSAVTYHWNDDGLRHFTRDIETTVSAGPQATLEEHQKAWQAEREKRYQALASTNVGVLAQEVEAVLPEAVSTDENGYKSVKYHYLTALLIAAFKEQENAAQAQARIVEQHEQEIARLRAATRIVYQPDPERAGQLPHAVQAQ